jgi:hypothetical protein
MRRHDFDGLSFAFGLFFAGAGLLLMGGATVRDSVLVAWAGPALLIALAVVIVIAARPRSSGDDEEPGESPAA